MTTYQVHTIDSAPRESKEALGRLAESIGMIPNLAASMAQSPELIQGFVAIREIQSKGSFGPAEIQVLSLTNAFENACSYCMALHSVVALKAGVSERSVQALRQGRSPEEPKLRALSDFSRKLVKDRGQVSADDIRAFKAAGFGERQALEVVLGVAVSVLANFSHHLTQCPLDEVFREQVWTER